MTQKEFFLKKMCRIHSDIREQLAERAAQNIEKYFALLRSTGEEGIEDLIVAIDESTFKTVGSARHHHYISGTLEHCLGVYNRMSRKAALMRKVGVKVNESDVILVGLLHDICNGRHPDWTASGHGKRSKAIVKKYLPNVSDHVLEAIEKHMHSSSLLNSNPLCGLILMSDMPDSATCDKGYVKLNDRVTVPLK